VIDSRRIARPTRAPRTARERSAGTTWDSSSPPTKHDSGRRRPRLKQRNRKRTLVIADSPQATAEGPCTVFDVAPSVKKHARGRRRAHRGARALRPGVALAPFAQQWRCGDGAPRGALAPFAQEWQ
jgi:hypothetical protein